jgi:HlyD family secretion protein
MKTTGRRVLLGAALAAALLLAGLALRPRPLAVETAPARTAPLRVTVEEEGRTRARDRFTVAAPVAGRLERVALREGDAVARDQVVARVHLAPMDPRERETASARLETARALEREAAENAQRARTDAQQARRDRERAERLSGEGYIPFQQLEQARSAETVALTAAEAARFRANAAASDVRAAKAALLAAEPGAGEEARLLALRAPAAGRVLRVLEESERVVPAGTPILVLGDPGRLEVVVDVLSSDAVLVRPGGAVLLGGWGGEGDLRAVVRTVEPSAFTKVSALGIEEQRVNVVADFVDAPGPLGDGYRVVARIVVWSSERALQVPASALFRRAQGEGWALFAVEGGVARLRPVEIGHRTPASVEVLSGIAEGARVVLHPPAPLRDGARVATP